MAPLMILVCFWITQKSRKFLSFNMRDFQNNQYHPGSRKKLAGTLLLGTDGQIPAMKTEHLETACEVNEQKVLHPFAYRVHTHGLGKVVSGYRVRTNSDGEQEWLQLGKRSPHAPDVL